MSWLTITPEPLHTPALTPIPTSIPTPPSFEQAGLETFSYTSIEIDYCLRTWPILFRPLDIEPRFLHWNQDYPNYHVSSLPFVTAESLDFLRFAAILRPYDFGQLPFVGFGTILREISKALRSGRGIHFLLDTIIYALVEVIGILQCVAEAGVLFFVQVKKYPLPARVLLLLLY
jgi:hypothetical protein